MTAPLLHERRIETPNGPARAWEKGEGPPVAFLGGLFGCPRWFRFLDLLAAHHRVVAVSLPGFPGGGCGHRVLDEMLDWITATLDLLERSGAAGGDLVGCSIGGMLAAECAAVSATVARRLVLVSPLGLFDEHEPGADPWTALPNELPGLLCADADQAAEYLAAPTGFDEAEWQIVRARASEAAAHMLWPIPDRGLAKRLHRVRAPSLLVWGDRDRIIPRSTGERFARLIPDCETRVVAGAGHAVELDRPDELAALAVEFLARQKET